MVIMDFPLKEKLKQYEEHLKMLEDRRNVTEMELEKLNQAIEYTHKKLIELKKSIEADYERKEHLRLAWNKFPLLLNRLGLELKEPEITMQDRINIAECLLAGYNTKEHAFYKSLHSKNPDVQIKAEQDMQLIKWYIEACRKFGIDNIQ